MPRHGRRSEPSTSAVAKACRPAEVKSCLRHSQHNPREISGRLWAGCSRRWCMTTCWSCTPALRLSNVRAPVPSPKTESSMTQRSIASAWTLACQDLMAPTPLPHFGLAPHLPVVLTIGDSENDIQTDMDCDAMTARDYTWSGCARDRVGLCSARTAYSYQMTRLRPVQSRNWRPDRLTDVLACVYNPN